MPISGYYSNNYWWFLYEWPLIIILFVAIGGYFVDGYWCLLMAIGTYFINGYW